MFSVRIIIQASSLSGILTWDGVLESEFVDNLIGLLR
jgi:hypothetical protein